MTHFSRNGIVSPILGFDKLITYGFDPGRGAA